MRNKTGGGPGSNQYGPRGVAKARTIAFATPVPKADLLGLTQTVDNQSAIRTRLRHEGYIPLQRTGIDQGYPENLQSLPVDPDAQHQLLLRIRRQADEPPVLIVVTEDGTQLGALPPGVTQTLLADRHRGGSWRIATPYIVTNRDTSHPDLYIQFQHTPAPLPDDYQPIPYQHYWPTPVPIMMAGLDPALLRQLRSSQDLPGSLSLVRQPDNPYDTNAIQIVDSNGKAIGYIPRDMAAQLGPDLDHDYLWEIESFRIDPREPPKWCKIHKLHRETPLPYTQQRLL